MKTSRKVKVLLVGGVLGYFFGKHFFDNVNISTISGYSMYPTISDKDYVYDESLPFLRNRLSRNDIVIVRDPEKNQRLIKRIIGLPGEPYVDEKGTKYEIPDGKYFVMGDNRRNSLDSRNFGPVSVETKVQMIVHTKKKANLNEFLEAVAITTQRQKDNFSLLEK